MTSTFVEFQQITQLTPVEADIAVEQWAKIGYECQVIWDYEREVFLAGVAH